LLPWRRETAGERPVQQRIEFAETLANLAGRQIQTGQAAALRADAALEEDLGLAARA